MNVGFEHHPTSGTARMNESRYLHRPAHYVWLLFKILVEEQEQEEQEEKQVEEEEVRLISELKSCFSKLLLKSVQVWIQAWWLDYLQNNYWYSLLSYIKERCSFTDLIFKVKLWVKSTQSRCVQASSLTTNTQNNRVKSGCWWDCRCCCCCCIVII